jgi:hypothetical protein
VRVRSAPNEHPAQRAGFVTAGHVRPPTARRGLLGDATIEALYLQYLERLLGHPPTPADAKLLPGINLPKLLSADAPRSRDGRG